MVKGLWDVEGVPAGVGVVSVTAGIATVSALAECLGCSTVVVFAGMTSVEGCALTVAGVEWTDVEVTAEGAAGEGCETADSRYERSGVEVAVGWIAVDSCARAPAVRRTGVAVDVEGTAVVGLAVIVDLDARARIWAD